MFSSMLPKSHRSPFAKLRQSQPQEQTIEPAPINMANPPPWAREEYADLRSRDKVKVKAAVRRFMENQVRNDWTFTWPPAPQTTQPLSEVLARSAKDTAKPSGPERVQDELNDDEGYQAEDQEDLDGDMNMDTIDDVDKQSEYEVEDEDETEYVHRIDWDSDTPPEESLSQKSLNSYGSSTDPEAAKRKREAQRRRAIRKEMEWNDGLACFEQRRNAWTEAKTVVIRKKPDAPLSPSGQNAGNRRSFFRSNRRSHSSVSSQAASNSGVSDLSPNRNSEKASNSGASTARSDSSAFTVVTVVPRQNKFLPPDNPLRASITSEKYLQLYDKVISNNLQPSCPINLSDMLGACVAGWTRDGEFSPRPALPIDPTFNPNSALRKKTKRNSWASPSTNANLPNSGRRLSITGFLRGNKDTEARSGKGVRQSLSQAFGLGSALPSQTTAAPQGATAG